MRALTWGWVPLVILSGCYASHGFGTPGVERIEAFLSLLQSEAVGQSIISAAHRTLFDGTIADNIGYAAPLASGDQIEDAARRAGAAEFIEGLPDGIISLSFVQADDDQAEELLLGYAGGGSEDDD